MMGRGIGRILDVVANVERINSCPQKPVEMSTLVVRTVHHRRNLERPGQGTARWHIGAERHRLAVLDIAAIGDTDSAAGRLPESKQIGQSGLVEFLHEEYV